MAAARKTATFMLRLTEPEKVQALALKDQMGFRSLAAMLRHLLRREAKKLGIAMGGDE